MSKRYKLLKDWLHFYGTGGSCTYGAGMGLMQSVESPSHYLIETGAGVMIPASLVENNSNWFEEVTKSSHTPAPESKYWEILTFIKDGNLLEQDEHKWKYRNETNAISDIDWLIKNCPIHSVRRLSDNTVWTVGGETKFGIIKKFELKEELIYWWTDKTWYYLSQLELPIPKPQPLFVTRMDNVEILAGNNFWVVDEDFEVIEEGTTIGDEPEWYKSYQLINTFSTKEAADEYVLMNKPCLSVNEVVKLWANDDYFPLAAQNLAESKQSKTN